MDLLRGDEQAISAQQAISDRLAITWVSAAELHYGAAKSSRGIRERALVDRFLATLPSLGPNRSSAVFFGELKAQLEREGQRLADADLFVAAACLSHGATLVTRNKRHFDRIPGLAVESWS